MKNYSIKWKSNRPVYIVGLIDEQVKIGCKDKYGDISKPTKYSDLGWLTWKCSVVGALFSQPELDSAMKDYQQALKDLNLKPEQFKEEYPQMHKILWRAYYAIQDEKKQESKTQTPKLR